ncbi:alanine racemase, partial [Vibrio sp. 10N.222.49.C9]
MSRLQAAVASINTDALCHNIDMLHKQAPNSRLLAVVKANG